MRNEVRTWRNIGLAFAISFFALTLTLLSFGANVFRQTSDLTNEINHTRSTLENLDSTDKQSQREINLLRSTLENLDSAGKQSQREIQQLKERVAVLEKSIPRKTTPSEPKKK